jgi:hypothetical protein
MGSKVGKQLRLAGLGSGNLLLLSVIRRLIGG